MTTRTCALAVLFASALVLAGAAGEWHGRRANDQREIDPDAVAITGGAKAVASTLVAGATVPCPSCAVAPPAADRA